MKTIIISIIALTFLFGCKKSNNGSLTRVHGTVVSASTGLPIPNVLVHLNEQTSGFPFSGGTIIEKVYTDGQGKFFMESNSKNPLSVAINNENAFLMSAAGYENVVWAIFDLPKGENHIVLRPAEFGYVHSVISSDLGADSIKLKEAYHVSFNPVGYVPQIITLYDGYNSNGTGDRIVGDYIVEYTKYLNGIATNYVDTFTVNKGQTTTYELHF